MISCSHWGVFASPPPMISLKGFKAADIEKARREWERYDGLITVIPLKHGEPQPIYQRLDFGKLD